MTAENWSKLSALLSLRRNLENALTPPEIIGSRSSGSRWQTAEERETNLRKSRARHETQSRELLESLKIRSRKQHLAKIEELRREEAELWKICRPDLYA